MLVNILIVDDAREIRKLLEKYLQLAGYENIDFASGCEELFTAIKDYDLEEGELDLILLDIVLPDGNGVEICRQLKMEPHFKDIPIIMVTGRDDGDTLKEAFSAGAMDYIKKPISRVELLARVSSALRVRKEIKKRNAREKELEETTRKLQKANKELERLASLDGLTGLANRRLFDEMLEKEWERARRKQNQLGLLMMDIDHFKYYNDAYGHQKGDDCLRKLAGKMSELLYRPGDTAARYGGEEFAAILPDTDEEGIKEVAERIRKGIKDMKLEHRDSPVSPYVTVSIGAAYAEICENAEPDRLVKTADKALYRAKEKGRDRVEVVDFMSCDL
ncbi:diguanylate cyclase domain-containing protein [Halarsenatibacter silvermanii]|uniref:Stage 0 sporulation protein A homolog n=1 Tax=Halarsenatibacter silvermanii TaxID=321763 RepID=A0A1G9S102_9FIRM|nr:diguanylate cyclase [Halarsenatibacter silvermanii]SDM29171.1 diguanylate cyclase (GGDEF) domain-containing protein [Halarsenatibacter silvermanii]